MDDNATNRLILTEVAHKLGSPADGGRRRPAALAALRSGCRARRAISRSSLVDGMMPEMDGFDLAEQIRREPEIAAVRLVLLTSAGQPDDTARCRDLAISICLTKPVRQSELFDALIKEMTLWTPVRSVPSPRGNGRRGRERSLPRVRRFASCLPRIIPSIRKWQSACSSISVIG